MCQCKGQKWDNKMLPKSKIETILKGFIMDQKRYIKRATNIGQVSNFTTIYFLLAKLSWVHHSRPDIFCAVPLLKHVTESV